MSSSFPILPKLFFVQISELLQNYDTSKLARLQGAARAEPPPAAAAWLPARISVAAACAHVREARIPTAACARVASATTAGPRLAACVAATDWWRRAGGARASPPRRRSYPRLPSPGHNYPRASPRLTGGAAPEELPAAAAWSHPRACPPPPPGHACPRAWPRLAGGRRAKGAPRGRCLAAPARVSAAAAGPRLPARVATTGRGRSPAELPRLLRPAARLRTEGEGKR